MEPWLQAWLRAPRPGPPFQHGAPHSSTLQITPALRGAALIAWKVRARERRGGRSGQSASWAHRPGGGGGRQRPRGAGGEGRREGDPTKCQLSTSIINVRHQVQAGFKVAQCLSLPFSDAKAGNGSTEMRDRGRVCVLERKLCSPDVPHKPRRCGRPGGQGRGSHEVRAGPEDFRSQSRGGKKAAVGRGTGQAAGGAVRPPPATRRLQPGATGRGETGQGTLSATFATSRESIIHSK